MLAVGHLPPAAVVDAEEGHYGVDDEQLEHAGLLVELAGDAVQQLELVLGVVGAGVQHVFQDLVLVQVVAVGDCAQAVRATSAGSGKDLGEYRF